MNQVRPLEPDDIPGIVALRRRVFSNSARPMDSALEKYYHMLFFENPWHDGRFSSLVNESPEGVITGFVGAIQRPMLLGEQKVTAITSTELMVSPEARGLIGPKLLRRLFDGPQEITFSDRGNEQARILFEGLGGNASLWHSLYWSHAIDGTRISFDSSRSERPRITSRMLRRSARILEKLAERTVSRRSLPTRDEPLDPETVVSITRKLAKGALVPAYDALTFSWLLQRLEERQNPSRVVSRQVTLKGQPIGWFIFAVWPGGDVDVVQLASLPGREAATFDHLVDHAASEGGTVLRGRLDRRFAQVISERGIPLTLGQPWTVVRATRADLSGQFLSGNAFFSRLDAEWWIDT